jgi:hypothetical protein
MGRDYRFTRHERYLAAHLRLPRWHNEALTRFGADVTVWHRGDLRDSKDGMRHCRFMFGGLTSTWVDLAR